MGSKQNQSNLTWLFVEIKYSVIKIHPLEVTVRNYLSLIKFNTYIFILN